MTPVLRTLYYEDSRICLSCMPFLTAHLARVKNSCKRLGGVEPGLRSQLLQIMEVWPLNLPGSVWCSVYFSLHVILFFWVPSTQVGLGGNVCPSSQPLCMNYSQMRHAPVDFNVSKSPHNTCIRQFQEVHWMRGYRRCEVFACGGCPDIRCSIGSQQFTYRHVSRSFRSCKVLLWRRGSRWRCDILQIPLCLSHSLPHTRMRYLRRRRKGR